MTHLHSRLCRADVSQLHGPSGHWQPWMKRNLQNAVTLMTEQPVLALKTTAFIVFFRKNPPTADFKSRIAAVRNPE